MVCEGAGKEGRDGDERYKGKRFRISGAGWGWRGGYIF